MQLFHAETQPQKSENKYLILGIGKVSKTITKHYHLPAHDL